VYTGDLSTLYVALPRGPIKRSTPSVRPSVCPSVSCLRFSRSRKA